MNSSETKEEFDEAFDIRSVFPKQNSKEFKSTSELCLSKHNIYQLKGFEFFPNIQILILSGNAIESLLPIKCCFRVKELYVQENCLQSLEPEVFAELRFVKILNAASNKICSLEKVISVVSELTLLKNLNLSNNQVVNVENYRSKICEIPHLEILDLAKIIRKPKKSRREEPPPKSFKIAMQNLSCMRYSTVERMLLNQVKADRKFEKENQKQAISEPEILLKKPVYTTKLPPVDYIKKSQESEFSLYQLSDLCNGVISKEAIISEHFEKILDRLINDELIIGKRPEAERTQLLSDFNNFLTQKGTLKLKDFQDFIKTIKMMPIPINELKKLKDECSLEAKRLHQLKDPQSHMFTHKFLKYETLIDSTQEKR